MDEQVTTCGDPDCGDADHYIVTAADADCALTDDAARKGQQ